MMTVVRLRSGVEGLDDLIGGGFPAGSNVLVTGGPGTGKSILGLQYVVGGALNGEPGIYLTVEENRDKIVSQAEQFGWDIVSLEKEKKLIINTVKEYDIEEILKLLKQEAKQLKAKRIVVDSLSMMSVFTRVMDKLSKEVAKKKHKDLLTTHGEELSRSQVVGILRKLSELGTTNLIISEGEEAADKIAEYAADGVIVLDTLSLGTEVSRTLTVKKMRETKISLDPRSMTIGEQGISVKELEGSL